MVTTTGWSSDQFYAESMDEVMRLLEYWEGSPPVHVIEAAKAGLGKRRRRRPLLAEEEPIEMKRPEELTPQEQFIEDQLPEVVRELRAKRREERRKQWQTTQSQSVSSGTTQS